MSWNKDERSADSRPSSSSPSSVNRTSVHYVQKPLQVPPFLPVSRTFNYNKLINNLGKIKI
jgi:hypothetical protein